MDSLRESKVSGKSVYVTAMDSLRESKVSGNSVYVTGVDSMRESKVSGKSVYLQEGISDRNPCRWIAYNYNPHRGSNPVE